MWIGTRNPLRCLRLMVNEALDKMSELFSQIDEADVKGGRPSIALEELLRAMLLQIRFNIRRECQLMEQTQYEGISPPVTTFSLD